MKLLSFNCRVLVSTHKKTSLKRLVSRLKPDIFFLQETMGSSGSVQLMFQSLLSGWEFLVMDAKGRSGGFATGWRGACCRISNSWGCLSCLGVDLFSQELNSSFCLVNVYGPYQDRVVFWDSFFSKPFLYSDCLIIGGDLNFTLGVSEIWCPKAIPDPLSHFFKSHLSQLDLFDLEPVKLNPTWRNRRSGEDQIAKRLDRFIVEEDIAFSHSSMARQWVDWGGNLTITL